MKRRSQEKGKRTKYHVKGKLAASALLLIISAVLMILAAQHPDFAEWYSENIYPLIVTSIGRLWGMLPFSASELGLYILIAAFLLSLGVMVKNVIKSKREAWGS